jgi:hypothetical protein
MATLTFWVTSDCMYTRKLRMERDSTTWKLICSFLVLLQTLLNPQLSDVIVTTYSGTHINFMMGRAGAEMK